MKKLTTTSHERLNRRSLYADEMNVSRQRPGSGSRPKLFYAGPLTPTHLDSLRASRTSSLSLASPLSSIGTEGPAAPGLSCMVVVPRGAAAKRSVNKPTMGYAFCSRWFNRVGNA